MDTFRFKDKILVGITLFSMFFGAGNLIFPPFLGAQAGENTWIAFIGFAVSAVCLPILGVLAVTKSGGLEKLTSRVHPKFSFIYILILYLAIGPCLAIPRTSSTSFSIAVQPFWGGEGSLWAARLVYSVVFFVLAAGIAMHPEKLTEYLGKRLTPILLILIGVVFIACLLKPTGDPGKPASLYENMAAAQGFLDGYQTMDTLAALNFGMIVAMNIREKGITREKQVVKETISAGWIAGVVLLVIYSLLAFIGMRSSGRFPGASNGTETLTDMVQFLFGKGGMVLLGIIFVIACFNTCVGLLCCCGKYFNSVFPKISYRGWVYIFAVISMVISNIGLDGILKFSVPALNAIYPLAILLILLSCVHRYIERYPEIYPWAALLCGISSIVLVLEEQGISIPVVTSLMRNMPGFGAGFGWLLPTVIGAGIGVLADLGKKKRKA